MDRFATAALSRHDYDAPLFYEKAAPTALLNDKTACFRLGVISHDVIWEQPKLFVEISAGISLLYVSANRMLINISHTPPLMTALGHELSTTLFVTIEMRYF